MVMFSLATIIMFNFALGMAVNVNLERRARRLAGAAMGGRAAGRHPGPEPLAGARPREPGHRRDAHCPGAAQRALRRKVISITVFTLLLDAVLVVLFTVFFNQPFYLPMVHAGPVPGHGRLRRRRGAHHLDDHPGRTREVLLPVLLLPVSLPLVLPAAMATTTYIAAAMLGEASWAAVQAPVLLVVAYDLLMLSVGFVTYQYVVES
jgi:hypothetical protein